VKNEASSCHRRASSLRGDIASDDEAETVKFDVEPKLPPRKYSAPTAVNARATLSAMSIAFSPTSAAIDVDVREEARGDVASVESTSESCADDVCWST
jgi:hypothetical protein